MPETEKMQFRKVTFEDRPLVEHYTFPYGERSCQCGFASMLSQQDRYGDEICEENGFLFILRSGLETATERVYLAPMGGGDLTWAYKRLLDDAHSYGKKAVLRTATRKHRDFLEKEFAGVFSSEECRDYAEYIFENEMLKNLEGKHFESKRRCLRLYEKIYGQRTEVTPITAADGEEIAAFEEIWLKQNCQDHDEAALRYEANRLRQHLEHFDQMGLEGFVLRIDGVVHGFLYGARCAEDCVDEIIGKADREVEHLYKKLYYEAAKFFGERYQYGNWEEDVGSEGLRSLKLSYQPAMLLEKYIMREL